jgi:hypothetical protein
MGERTSVLQTAQPRRFQPPVYSTAGPTAAGGSSDPVIQFRAGLSPLCTSAFHGGLLPPDDNN